MIFITIPLLLVTLAWTAVFVLSYNDWNLILKGSLPAWAVCSAVLTLAYLIRLVFKHKTLERTALVSRAAVAAAASIIILVLAVSAPDWFDSGPEPTTPSLRVDLTDTSQPPHQGESKRLLRKKVAAEVPSTEKAISYTGELWSVQVGAFKREQDAFELARALRTKGYNAYVMEAEVDSVSLYRAKVGRFRTRDEAERLLEVLRDKEAYKGAFVSKM